MFFLNCCFACSGKLGFSKDRTGQMGVRQRVLQEGREALAVWDPQKENCSAAGRHQPTPTSSPPPAFCTRRQRPEFLPLSRPSKHLPFRFRRARQLVWLPPTLFPHRSLQQLSDSAFGGQRKTPAKQLAANVWARAHEEALQRHHIFCAEPCEACRSKQFLPFFFTSLQRTFTRSCYSTYYN